jgi:cytochrome c oxidase subunit 1
MSAAADKSITLDGQMGDQELHARLAHTWRTENGLLGRLASVDHKVVGRRFIITAFIFLILGGLSAVVMRLQLARPGAELVGPDVYRQLLSMHGTTMMFLFAVPVMEAFATYLVPLMVGTRNIAFPRLNAFSYWVYLFGGSMIWVAFMLNTGAEAGWFSYVPLAGPEFSPGKRTDFWAQMITFTELSALAVSIEIVATVFKFRAPGMTLDRIPLFVWSMLVTAIITLFAMPAVMLASTLLILDRLVGTHFYNPAEGGDALLWQHLFWFFGHPEVYIIFLPAAGMVSAILPTFVRRPMLGYLPIVLALVATGFLSFGLWVHHMFTVGLPQLGASFFTAASMVIAVPSSIQVLFWIATIWLGRPVYRVPFLYIIGFLITFVAGGLTGVMTASVPLDLHVHDTYFVVAHFHYVLVGGALFPLLAAVTYWYPKITGRMMSETLGRRAFWLAFIGFNVTFFPMHFLGFAGMPRRVYTYAAERGWGDLNLIATAGGVVLAAGLIIFLWNVIRSARRGEVAGENPWGAATLEWATTSPPQPYNFARMPVVNSRDPLWENRDGLGVASGLAVDMRQQLVTSVTESLPEVRLASPTPTIWPLVVAILVAITFIGSVYTPWAVVWGSLPLGIALTAWFWPSSEKEDQV